MKNSRLNSVAQVVRSLVLVWFVLYIAVVALNAQVVPITFQLSNVKAGPSIGPWMFEFDDQNLWKTDGNCYTPSNPTTENFAYQHFFTVPGTTTSSCVSENLDFVPNTNGFRIEFDSFDLTGFHKINTVNGNMGWNNGGQAGDKRQYTGGVGRIYRNDVLVLTVRDCVLEVTTPYPTAAQMRAMFWDLWHANVNWQQEVGTGEAVVSLGRGVIDDDPAFSDPQWVAAFANDNGNQVDFILSTINYVVQFEYGWYSFDLGIRAAAVEQNCFVQNIDLGSPGLIDFDAAGIQMDFSQVVGGGAEADLNAITVNHVITPPTGNIPFTVLQTLPEYWDFSTNMESFNTEITFDLTGRNLGSPENWIVLRRPVNSEWWIQYGNITVLDDHTIRANNVIEFSEWTVGSSEEPTLPVELSTFNAVLNQSGVIELNWISQSETELAGYRVYRSNENNNISAMCLNGDLIPATNTSQISHYSFTDLDNQEFGTWYYWLECIELNGSSEFYGPVSVILTEDIDDDPPTPDMPKPIQLSAYPNPFNPSTNISFYLPQEANTSMAIYNIKGEKVKLYPTTTYSEGWHRIYWNGLDTEGRSSSSGIYFIRLQSGESTVTQKIVLSK